MNELMRINANIEDLKEVITRRETELKDELAKESPNELTATMMAYVLHGLRSSLRSYEKDWLYRHIGNRVN